MTDVSNSARRLLGTRIGNFELRRVLGAGGMGAVFLAEHVHGMDEARVYKFLLPHLSENQPVVQRFIGEARAASALKHRNIMRARDFGSVAGSMYIEMDWFEGQTLASVMSALPGPMPPSQMIALMSGMCAGIYAAHNRGIIHRDLKPENILVVTLDGLPNVAKVLDFGVAKLQGELASGAATRAGDFIGTPVWAPPESFEASSEKTHAIDIWALGAIAYAMLTGWLPFQVESTRDAFYSLSPMQIYARMVARPPIDPRERVPGINPATAAVIMRALDRDPSRRYATARELAIALAETVTSEGRPRAGLDILRKYAPDLLDDSNMLETIRSPGPGRQPQTSRYHFERKLGEGGMAEVFIGRLSGAEGFAKSVAIKRVLSNYSANPMFVELFRSEAQFASKLAHPNIVSVLDFDKDTQGRLFLVMEYVEGKDLTTLIKTGALPPSVAVFVAIEILRGLEHAHGQLILHRDISPHNVLVSWTGGVKVSDFGIAKALDASGSGHSMTVKGKPSYMSPEQIRADVLDARSDLFAVGIVLWEMVAGRRLFTGSPDEAVEALLYRDSPPPSTVRPVPRDLEAVIMRLLARDKQHRYSNAAQAIADLAACANNPRDGRGELVRLLVERFPDAPKSLAPLIPTPDVVSARDPILARNDRDSVPTATMKPPPQVAQASTLGGSASQSLPAPKHAKRPRWPFLAAASVIAAAGGLVAVVVAQSRRTPTTIEEVANAPSGATAIAIPPSDAATLSSSPIDAQLAVVPALDAPLAPTSPADAPIEPIPPSDAAGPQTATVRTSAPTVFGKLEITADPWAVVTITDLHLRLGQTPVDAKLPVGRHTVLMKKADKHKTFTITISKDRPVVRHEIPENW